MIGQTVSHYRIIEKLGEGGMGVVYRAEDLKLRRPVALKFLPPELTRDPDAKRRFRHEAEAAAALDHPNICNVHEVDETADGQVYIAMACYEGETLREKIARGPLPLGEAMGLAIQAGEGLAEAHASGILHRDIKPANLFVTAKGQVKVLDFGLAKLAGASVLTKNGTTLGTAGYLSPEQARGEAADARADIWSLGVVLYELVAGRLPFRGEYAQAVIYGILNESPPPLTALRTGVPPELERIVAKCLAKDPAARYPHVEDLLVDLRGVQRELGAAPTAPMPAGSGAPAPATQETGRRLARPRRPIVVALAGTVVLLTVAAVYWATQPAPPSVVPRASKVMLVVLPMENLSGDPQQEYFSDGLTEEMIAQLGRLEPKRLGVIARTSAMQYKHTPKSIGQVGQELGVEYVLEGSVRRAGSRVRVTAQLIQVRDQTHLWAESFERDVADVFAVQAEVAERVARSLAIELLPERKEAMARGGTANPAAHEAYLRGRFLWHQRGKTNYEQAVELFQQAVSLDPDYAAAYAGLSDVYQDLYFDTWVPPAVVMPQAEAAAKKALELDPSSAEAHVALGGIRKYLWDWPGAEREYRKALELDPGSSTALNGLGLAVALKQNFDQAIAYRREAVRIDPASPVLAGSLAATFRSAHRFEEARSAYEEAIRRFPNTSQLRLQLASVLNFQGHFTEAAAVYWKASEYYSGGYRLLYEAHALALEGRTREARDRVEIVRKSKNEFISPIEIAFVLMDLKDTREALAELERGISSHDGESVSIIFHPSVDPIRSNPRFQALLRKMNLPVDGTK
ncbi:MAG TPA: protein kinase [Acidobacteriota bacterium]|nr:protein kinase [Acidobacteriota bacterium]HQM64964.1 protein kinase [Acidobacteriota bacterium]